MKPRLTIAMMSLLLTTLPLHADWRNDASEEEKIANLTTLMCGATGVRVKTHKPISEFQAR